MPDVVAVYVVPDPKVVVVPFGFVPCQYQVVPVGGTPVLVKVEEVHCGELLVGLLGDEGVFVIETTILALALLQQPVEFKARR